VKSKLAIGVSAVGILELIMITLVIRLDYRFKL